MIEVQTDNWPHEIPREHRPETHVKWRSIGRIFREAIFTWRTGHDLSRSPFHAPSGASFITTSHVSASNDTFWRKKA